MNPNPNMFTSPLNRGAVPVNPYFNLTLSPQMMPASFPFVNQQNLNNLAMLQRLNTQLQEAANPNNSALHQLGQVSAHMQQVQNAQNLLKQSVGLSCSNGFNPADVKLSKSPQLSTSTLLLPPRANPLKRSLAASTTSTLSPVKKKTKSGKLDRYRKRCLIAECSKLSQGNTKFCFAHGGGYRCQSKDCPKPARGRTGFCIAHGGGKRCKFTDCTKSAQGRTEFCKRHGGGKRCQFINCKTSARGSTTFCTAHGGGRRCQFYGCSKSARDNSCFCVAHGGGKRCIHPSCTKSAIGSTKHCTRHGDKLSQK